jgi:DNA-binding NtrC family response regulator/tetratricopeptide (TPR) repeat protein
VKTNDLVVMERADALVQEKRYGEAARVLEQISINTLTRREKACYCLIKADINLNQGMYEIEDLIHFARDYFRSSNDNHGFGRACFLNGLWLIHQGELLEAQEPLADALHALKRCDAVGLRIKVLMRIAYVSHELGDYAAALSYLDSCLQLCRSINDCKTPLLVLSNKACVSQTHGHFQTALSVYGDLVTFVLEMMPKDKAIFYSMSALTPAYFGEYALAESIIAQALPCLDGFPREQAIYYENLGTIHLLEEDYAAAEDALLEGLKISLDIAPESALVSQIKRRLGDAYFGLGRFDTAKKFTEEGLVVAQKINERAEIAACWRILAQFEHHHGNADKARDWFNRAIDLFSRIGSLYELAVTRYLAAVSGLFGEGGRQALLYLAREYFGKEAVKPYLEKIDREMKAAPRPEPSRPRTDGSEPPLVITVNPAMTKRLEMARNIAPSEMAVLLTGPSGVGKDLLAKYIHHYSGRTGRFILVNTPAIPDDMVESELFGHKKGAFTGAEADKIGLIEEAEGGTLYLNEIGDASAKLQAKLLDVLESKKFRRLGETKARHVDFRIIAATNHNLDELIRQQRFRADLFHRLNQVNLDLPALSARRDDIPALVMHFLACFGVTIGGNGDGLWLDRLARNLSARDWPGNVRQLRNEVEKLVLIHRGNLSGMSACSGPSCAEHPDRDCLAALLEQYRWNQSAVARALGITEGAVRHRMTLYRIRSPKSRNGTNYRHPIADG